MTPADGGPRVAAVDAGSNSVRLLVASAGEPLRPVHREMRVTRLGKGVDGSGRLDDDALARTLDCLEEYAERWRSLGATSVRITATSAVRDAADRERFFTGAAERTGVRPVVLSGEEEARIAFTGATRSVTAEPPYLVLDIGGGSTELVLGYGEPAAIVSRQLGCVRLTESRLGGDPPTAAQLRAARAEIDGHLDAVFDVMDPSSAHTLIGVAGTVTTLAALDLRLPRYEPERIHGARLRRQRVRDLTRDLATLRAADIAALGPMAPGREDVIVGGALILELVMERYGFSEVLVSEADILDGLALQLLAADVEWDPSVTPASGP